VDIHFSIRQTPASLRRVLDANTLARSDAVRSIDDVGGRRCYLADIPWMNVIHPERWLAGVPFEQVVNDANVTGPDECARSRNATGQTRQERRHRTMWIPKCFGREPSCMVLPSTLAVTVFQFSGEFLEQQWCL